MSLFVKKTLSSLLAQAADSEKGLKKTLGAVNLVALGIQNLVPGFYTVRVMYNGRVCFTRFQKI